MAGSLPRSEVLVVLLLYSLGAHGIMTLNDFKAVTGDKATGVRSLPVRALDFMNDMLWYAALIAGPVMLATLLVGLTISVFQVATQIQEITLSYVPKILTAGLILVIIGPWMLSQLTGYARDLYLTIPALAQ